MRLKFYIRIPLLQQRLYQKIIINLNIKWQCRIEEVKAGDLVEAEFYICMDMVLIYMWKVGIRRCHSSIPGFCSESQPLIHPWLLKKMHEKRNFYMMKLYFVSRNPPSPCDHRMMVLPNNHMPFVLWSHKNEIWSDQWLSCYIIYIEYNSSDMHLFKYKWNILVAYFFSGRNSCSILRILSWPGTFFWVTALF